MGRIEIKTVGSFPLCSTHIESALAGGHAAALGRAIGYLTDMLPDAIAKDHQRPAEGELPPDGLFGEPSTRDWERPNNQASACEHGMVQLGQSVFKPRLPWTV